MEFNDSFTIRATYSVLLPPTNLHLWFGKDPVSSAAPVTLKHILMGCKTSLVTSLVIPQLNAEVLGGCSRG